MINLSTERNQSISSQNRVFDVVFYASENLFSENLFGNKELAIKKFKKVKLPLDTARTYESYCFEFCGLLNLQLRDLKFFINNKELSMQRNVRKAIEIDVYNRFFI